jgi:hypothetical protein
MGVSYTPLRNTQTDLASLVESGEIHYVSSKPDPFMGKVLRVDTLPGKKGPAKFSTPALLHPEMAAYKAKIEEMGYRLVVDTSIQFTGTGGYLWESERTLAILPDSDWATFAHEFQHLEFAHYLEKGFGQTASNVKRGYSLSSLLPAELRQTLGSARIKRLEALIRRELPEMAINETLSVEAELKTMGFRRFTPLARARHAKNYALRHQITGLLKTKELRPLNAKERSTLHDALVSYALLENPGKAAAAGAIVQGGAALVVYEAMDRISAPGDAPPRKRREYRLDDFKAVYYDDHGNMIGVTMDGKLTYLKLAKK